MRPGWRLLADDFSPRDLDSFVWTKQKQWSVNLGIYRDGELGGYLSQSPVSPVVCMGHAVFKKSFRDRETMVTALRKGIEVGWEMGYQKIWCHIYQDNRPMIRLLEIIGARFEGVLYSHTLREGKLVNMVSYAITKEG